MPPTFGQRLWDYVNGLFIIPALLAEYTLGYAALASVKLWGRTKFALFLADVAGQLRSWRFMKSEHIWLSIK
jgi:hypothetical protein